MHYKQIRKFPINRHKTDKSLQNLKRFNLFLINLTKLTLMKEEPDFKEKHPSL
jgi:hypothetical protein